MGRKPSTPPVDTPDPAGGPPTPHIVLVGMMGSGKTSVGRRLAKLVGRPFVDGDEGFIARYAMTVRECFADEGEPAFRRREEELMAALLGVGDPLVIAAGGGAVTSRSTRKRLSSARSFTVYLEADPDYLAARAEAKAHRPLLTGDALAVMRRLHGERRDWYTEVADLTLPAGAAPGEGRPAREQLAREIAHAAGCPLPGDEGL